MPELDVRALAAGLALSVMVAILSFFLGFPAIGTLVAIVAGGYIAGRMAGRHGLYHGAMVAVLAIVIASIAASAGNANVTNILADTLTIVLSDVLMLLCGSAGGWVSTRS